MHHKIMNNANHGFYALYHAIRLCVGIRETMAKQQHGNIAQNKVLTDAEHVTAIKKLDNGKILRTLENDTNPKTRNAATERLGQLFQE